MSNKDSREQDGFELFTLTASSALVLLHFLFGLACLPNSLSHEVSLDHSGSPDGVSLSLLFPVHSLYLW